MSRKNFFIIISIVLVVFVLSLAAYYFLILSNGQSSTSATGGFKQFYPFGGTATSTNGQNFPNTNQTGTATTTQNFAQKLRKIWSEPVAGFGLLDVKAGTVARHIEVATGHIYETELFSPVQNRISNTTIPLVYNAFWGNKNKTFVAQYLKDDNETINTFVLTVKDTATSTENAVAGYALENGIGSVSVSGNTLFYLEQSDAGSFGFIGTIDGSKQRKQIWSSPLKDISAQIVNNTSVALTTKPYSNIGGYLYILNTNTGGVKKILGNIAGLSSLVYSDLSKVLYLSQTDTAQMFLYDVKNDTAVNITPATFPEKCVWSKKNVNIVYCAVPEEYLNGGSLTAWYMGMASFTDDIWKYDLKQNTSSVIERLTDDSGEKIDVIKPLLSDSEQYLVFINKIDGSLWSLGLTK